VREFPKEFSAADFYDFNKLFADFIEVIKDEIFFEIV
jgi:hypothetical protein